MKKTKVIRIVCLVAMCALLSSCVMTGMFAKYATSGGGEGEAQVAKWGVTVSAAGGAFSTKYIADQGVTEGDNLEVASSTEAKVVAPGTKGVLVDGAISGQPEVAVKVTIAPTLTLTGWEVNSADYCPIVFTVGDKDYKIDGGDITTVAGLKAAVEAAIANTVEYAPNTDLAKDIDVSWKWPFHVSDENDKKDTALANLATAPTIKFEYTITVEQIDTYPTPTESQAP